jgi:hypothetical protein
MTTWKISEVEAEGGQIRHHSWRIIIIIIIIIIIGVIVSWGDVIECFAFINFWC